MSYDFTTSGDDLRGSFTTAKDLPISLACWVKKAGATWGSNQDGFIQLGETEASATDTIAILAPGPADRIHAKSKNAGGNSSASIDMTTDAADDVWILVYGIFTTDTARRIGWNTWAQSNTSTGDIDAGSTLDQIMLGNMSNGSNQNLDGLGAEFAIWDKALVEADIDALWTSAQAGGAASGVQAGNLIGYWPCDTDRDIDGTILNEGTDATGDMTIDAATFDADHPTITAGGGATNPKGPLGMPLHGPFGGPIGIVGLGLGMLRSKGGILVPNNKKFFIPKLRLAA